MTDPDPDEIEQFWELARNRLRTNPIPGYFGQFSGDALAPPAWAFGDNAEMADNLLALVLAGTKTATAGALRDYEAAGENLPEVGDLSILLDGRAHPRALIEIKQVQIVPFSEVDDEHARLEGEGDLSLRYWREGHAAFFARTSPEPFSEDLPVVLERFKLVYPGAP